MVGADFQRRPAAGRILIGYQHTPAGRDAVQLGIALATGRNIELEIVMVEPAGSPYGGVYPHDRGYSSLIEEQIASWLTEALEQIPDEITATAQILVGESEVETLLDYARETDADALVVGARQGGLFNRFHMGSVVNALLHSSEIPIALAPSGYTCTGPIARSTAFFGPRPGAADVIATAVDRSQRRGIPLRLISLALHNEPNGDADALALLDRVTPPDLNAVVRRMLALGDATVDIAAGSSTEAALSMVEFRRDDIAVLGSSRMAVPGRLFLGPTAARILRNIPAPILVVPAGAARTNSLA